MSRMAQKRLKWEEGEAKKKEAEVQAVKNANPDKRNLASKAFDTINLFDSGRSATTATPSKEGAEKSGGDQAKNIVGSLFSGTEKTFDAVNALTGGFDRQSEQLDKDLKSGKIDRKEYQKKLKEMQDDIAWAGTEDKGVGDRLKKGGGVAVQTVSEFIPVGKGVKAGQALKETVKGGSKMARAKLAADVGSKTAVIGAAGGAGGAVAEEGATGKDIATQALFGAGTGGVLGAAGTTIPFRRMLDERGSVPLPVRMKSGISDDLKAKIDNGKVDGRIIDANANDLRLDHNVDPATLDRPTIEQYKARIKNGEEVDPIVVQRGEDGADFIKDGAHRYIAAKESGVVNIPSVRAKDNVVMAEKVAPPTIDTLSAKVNRRPYDELQTKIEEAHNSGNKELAAELEAQLPDQAMNPDAPAMTPERRAELMAGAKSRFGSSEPVVESLPTPIYRVGGKGQWFTTDKKYLNGENGVLRQDKLPNDTNLLDLTKSDIREMDKLATPEELVRLKDSSTRYEDSTALREDILKRNGYDGYRQMEEGSDGNSYETVFLNKDKSPDFQPPVQLKVLDDLQTEARVRSPGDDSVSPSQKTETKTQQGAGYVGEDLERLEAETGLNGITPIDQSVAKKASDALQGKIDQPTAATNKRRDIANQFQDSKSVMAKTIGTPGVDLHASLLVGEKMKRDALTHLRDDLVEIRKLNDKLSGATRFKKGSRTAQIDVSKRIGEALDDRANVTAHLKNPEEIKLFEHYVKVFDYIKDLREKLGLEVLENYRPHVQMRKLSEEPTWLADSLTNGRIDTLSRFSKERVSKEAGENVDDDLASMIYGYVNSQLNEFAYDAPIRKFKKDLSEIPVSSRNNSPQFKEGIEYAKTLVQQAVSPTAKGSTEKLINKAASATYGAVLPFNVRLTFQNMTQRLAANSRVTKGAVKLSKKMDSPEFKDLENGLSFGDSTVFGQLQDMSEVPMAKGKNLVEKAKKLDYYQKGEHKNVITSFRKGAAQAIMESDAYKTAVKAGSKRSEAAKIALQDTMVKKLAMQRGNNVVNDTQFAASHLARPAALRSEGRIFGIPTKALTMFTRFPIGMTQHALEIVKVKDARALDVLKNGDPRSVPIAEMRHSYGVLLDGLKDSKKAIDNGTDIGIPKDVITEQISVIDKNLKIIDKSLKKYSQVRSGKTAANLAKMWVAAAAIQVVFDGGIQSFADDPGASSGAALQRTNPTVTSFVSGKNSKLGGVGSAASPISKYGGLNERAITNYIPGVGLAVNRGRDIGKLAKSLMGEDEE